MFRRFSWELGYFVGLFGVEGCLRWRMFAESCRMIAIWMFDCGNLESAGVSDAVGFCICKRSFVMESWYVWGKS